HFQHNISPNHILSTFSITVPSPPRSTLFPYTTFFRSPPLVVEPPLLLLVVLPAVLLTLLPLLVLVDVVTTPAIGVSPVPPSKNKDRKSTRLNASHVAISYAVLCLKKKN